MSKDCLAYLLLISSDLSLQEMHHVFFLKLKNLKLIQPDFFAKGFEYTSSGLPPATKEEAKIVEGYGGEMIFTPGDIIYSSTKLLNLSQPKIDNYKLNNLMENNVYRNHEYYNLIEREYINDNELFIEIFQDNRVNIMKKMEETANASDADLDEILAALSKIDADVKKTIVPLSYADELYNLRLHIQMIKDHVERNKHP